MEPNVRGERGSAPLKLSAQHFASGLALGADQGGRAAKGQTEDHQEHRGSAVEDTFEGQNICERHDKISFFSCIPPAEAGGWFSFKPLGEEGLSYLDDA